MIALLLALVVQDEPDYSGELPRIPPRSAEEALRCFEVVDGFEVQLVAAEPEVVDPVALCFDADARAYVVEMRGYSERADEDLGRVRRLDDLDGDGRYESARVFLDGLSWPTAVAPWRGGVFVAASGGLLYARDDDGDGVADTRRPLWRGFSRQNVQGLVNSLRWGPDLRIWGATSISGARLRGEGIAGTGPHGTGADAEFVLRGQDFSFDPRTMSPRAEAGGAQHGACFDDAGRRFVCSNSDHLQMIVYDPRYAARRPELPAPAPRVSIALDGPQAPVFRISEVEPWRILRTRLRVAGEVPGPIEGGGTAAGYFTGSTGVLVYRGDAWPAETHGQVLVGDVGSNIVHRKRLLEHGVEFRGERIDAQREFVASSDPWFRPVQFANAPDGSLWILDMAREVIEHPASLPPAIKRHLDLNSGNDRGRLWRVAPVGFRAPPPPRRSQASDATLIAMLGHDNAWHRETATRLLFEREAGLPPASVELVRGWCRPPPDGIPGTLRAGPVGAALALLAHAKQLEDADLMPALSAEDAGLRELAVRFAEERDRPGPELLRGLLQRVDDPVPRVRFQLAFTLGEIDARQEARGDEAGRALVRSGLSRLMAADAADPWMRFAISSSLRGSADAWLRELLEEEHPASCRVSLGLVDRLDDPDGALRRQLEAKAVQRSQDARLEPAERAAALRLRARFDPDWDAMEAWRPDATEEESRALLEVLARASGEETATRLLAHWRRTTPSVRHQVLDLLASRAEWSRVLLRAMEQGELPAAQVGRPFLARLARHPDEEIRVAARRRLAVTAMQEEERQEKIDQVLALSGDAVRGRAVFLERCAACHRLDGLGHEVGPQLRQVLSRGASTFLYHVFEPNAEIQPAYVDYVVFTRDGRTLSGLLHSEAGATLTLLRGEGMVERLRRDEVELLRSSGKSLMPEGLSEDLDPGQLADLLAFVREGAR